MNENNTSFKVSDIVTFSGLLLIFLGFLKQQIFYSGFNINIANYLDLSEVVTLFMNDIIIFIFVIPTIIVLTSIFQEKLSFHKSLINKEIYKERKLTNRLIYLMKDYLIFIPLFFLTIIYIIFILKLYDTEFIIRVFLPAYLFPFSSLIRIELTHFLYKLSFKNKNISFSRKLIDPIEFLFFSTVLTILISNLEVIEYKYFNKAPNTFVYLENRIMKSDSVNYYLGKTNSFLFFYNSKLRESTIIPMISVKQIVTKKED